MRIKDVSKLITESLVGYFEKNDFRLNRKLNEFKRSINDCIQIFDLVFYKEGNHLKIRPQIRIKIKPIEPPSAGSAAMETRGPHRCQCFRFRRVRF